MRASDVRRWIAGFEEAAERDRLMLRRQGPDSAQSIRLALSLIAAARRAGWPPAAGDPARERDAEAVRQTWATLRRRLADVARDARRG
jgi:hypothetical protein